MAAHEREIRFRRNELGLYIPDEPSVEVPRLPHSGTYTTYSDVAKREITEEAIVERLAQLSAEECLYQIADISTRLFSATNPDAHLETERQIIRDLIGGELGDLLLEMLEDPRWTRVFFEQQLNLSTRGSNALQTAIPRAALTPRAMRSVATTLADAGSAEKRLALAASKIAALRTTDGRNPNRSVRLRSRRFRRDYAPAGGPCGTRCVQTTKTKRLLPPPRSSTQRSSRTLRRPRPELAVSGAAVFVESRCS